MNEREILTKRIADGKDAEQKLAELDKLKLPELRDGDYGENDRFCPFVFLVDTIYWLKKGYGTTVGYCATSEHQKPTIYGNIFDTDLKRNSEDLEEFTTDVHTYRFDLAQAHAPIYIAGNKATGKEGLKMAEELKHKFENVSGSVSIDKLKIVSVSKPKYASVDLCIKAGCNIPFAEIRLYSRDRFVDAEYCFESAKALGKEIEDRYNSHDALLAACRAASKLYASFPKDDILDATLFLKVQNQLKQAIAQAGKK